MRRNNLLFLAGTQLCSARSASFSIHDDLLAYPQFEVVFARDYISEKDAQALINRNNQQQHPTYSAEFSKATGDHAHATTTTDAAVPSSNASDEIAGYAYEILNLSPHRYLCSIPVIEPPGPVNETENALAKVEEEREHQRAAVKGWELISKLEGSCLYYVSGWWSYSFCNNREIVQYHAISVSSNGQIPRRDPNGQEYILGRVPALPATTGDRKQRRQQRDFDDPPRPPAELQVKGDQRYLVQKLEGGTICDLTGKDRKIEVQYQCVPGIKTDKIGWIKEVVTCSYVMMINTPRLCSDVAFQPPVEKSANPINCKLISESVVALQCVAAPVALLLSSPETVQRADGSKVIVKAEKSLRAEFKSLWKLTLRKDLLLLLPVFWAAYFNQYSGNFQTYYFGVRARALIGFVSNFGTLLSSQLMSWFLDYDGIRVKRRIELGFYYVVVWHVIAWVYGWVIQEKYTANPPVWDWTDAGFVEGFFVLLLWDFARQALQNWLYYFLATKTDNISELSRFSGILRGQESFAQAISYGLNTREWKGGRVPLAVNTILLGLSVYPTWLAVRDHDPVEHGEPHSVSQREVTSGRIKASVDIERGS